MNIGLALMVITNLFPEGILQVGDMLENGYWHARSPERLNDTRWDASGSFEIYINFAYRYSSAIDSQRFYTWYIAPELSLKGKGSWLN